MRRFFMKSMVAMVLLFLLLMVLANSCSKKGKTLETYYFPDQMTNIEQLTTQMNLLTSPLDDLPVGRQLSLLFTIERHLELVQVFDAYYNDLNESLLNVLKKYQSFLEGSFFKLQIALLERKYGDATLALKYLEDFKNDPHTPDKFKQFAGDLLTALDAHKSMQVVFKKYMNDREINELAYVVLTTFKDKDVALDISPALARSNYLKFISEIDQQQYLKAIRLGLEFDYFSTPLYQERVNVKETHRQIDKPFYDLDYYRHLLRLMQGLFENRSQRFLRSDVQSFITQLDSTRQERLFYYLLQISDGFYFVPISNFSAYEKLLNTLARTDFQKALLAIQSKAIRLRSHPSANTKLEIPALPDFYHPFMHTILRVYAIKQYSKAGAPIDMEEIESVKEDVYANALQDVYREKLLSYLGEGLLKIKRWKEASIYLNYNVRSGYKMSQNDALILGKLAFAYFQEKNQLSLSVWILKELSNALPYAKILHLYNQFYLQARYFKVSGEKGTKVNRGEQ